MSPCPGCCISQIACEHQIHRFDLLAGAKTGEWGARVLILPEQGYKNNCL